MSYLSFLRDTLDKHFDLSEIRSLCLDLSIEFENLRGTTRIEICESLVIKCNQLGKLEDLKRLFKQRRPNVDLSQAENIKQEYQPVEPLNNNAQNSLIEDVSVLQDTEIFRSLKVTINSLLDEEIKQITETKLQDSESIQSKIQLAEKANLNKDFFLAANYYKEVSKLFAEQNYYMQAKKYSNMAAQNYLEASDKESAIEQHLTSAQLTMNHTAFAITIADNNLEQAEKISAEVNNYSLTTKIHLLQAQYDILLGRMSQAEKRWQKVERHLPKVRLDYQLEISTDLALQKAMVSRLNEDWDLVKSILIEADARDWPSEFLHKRLELLRCLLFLHAELGEWDQVEEVYRVANNLVPNNDNFAKASWTMHYAATLAKKGDAKKALEQYLSVLDFFKSDLAKPFYKHHFFQDMLHVLVQNAGNEVFSSVLKFDSERLDLALNFLNQDIGHLHREKAQQHYVEGKVDQAIIHAQYALMLAWRKGDWSGLSESYKLLSVLYFADKDFVLATLMAIHSATEKKIKEYAHQLNNLQDREEIAAFLHKLLAKWPNRTLQLNALIALNECTDIVPDTFLDSLFDHLKDILNTNIEKEIAVDLCSKTIKVLQSFAPRLNSTQTAELIQVGLDIIAQKINWTIKRDVVHLISSCFQNGTFVEFSLVQKVIKKLEEYSQDVNLDFLKEEINSCLLQIAFHGSQKVKKLIAHIFHEKKNTNNLAVLGEPIPKNQIEAHFEELFNAITPQRENGALSYSGVQARSINNFNSYLTPSTGIKVIDGLTSAVKNPTGFLNQKSDAIVTIRWLPEKILKIRSNEICLFLLDVFSGHYTESEDKFFTNWFGNVESIYRSSLYTLGRLYSLVNKNLQKRIANQIILSSQDTSAIVRMGCAMAFRVLEVPKQLPADLVFILIELLQDENMQVRHWAASALGHQIATGAIPSNTAKFFVKRLRSAATIESASHARAGIAYAFNIIMNAENSDLWIKNQIKQVYEDLKNDPNFSVRKMALGQ